MFSKQRRKPCRATTKGRWLTRASPRRSAEPLGDPPTYRIVRRYRRPPKDEVIHEGYTLEEAQRHCEDPSTHGVDWMDTYEKE